MCKNHQNKKGLFEGSSWGIFVIPMVNKHPKYSITDLCTNANNYEDFVHVLGQTKKLMENKNKKRNKERKV